jgi:hypothetical protein
MAQPDNRPKTPSNATPDDALRRELRASMEASLRAKYGQKWVEDNKGLLDAQWDFLKDVYRV